MVQSWAASASTAGRFPGCCSAAGCVCLSPRVERYSPVPLLISARAGSTFSRGARLRFPDAVGNHHPFRAERMRYPPIRKGLGELSWEQMQQEVEELLREYLVSVSAAPRR